MDATIPEDHDTSAAGNGATSPIAFWALTIASIGVSVGVLIGLGLVWLGYVWADPVVALLVAGVIAKAIMHVHLTMLWTTIVGIIGGILGGAVTHMFAPPRNARFHPAGLIFSTL